eukprot:COSAG02_NODE_200_length_29507_cov_440.183487_5_plen_97_part_00
MYLFIRASELDCSPAEELENHQFSAEIPDLEYDTVSLCADRPPKFSSAVCEPYMNGKPSSSAFQRGMVHLMQIAFASGINRRARHAEMGVACYVRG